MYEGAISLNYLKSIAWLSFLAFFSVLNETVFNVSLPDIAVQFGISPAAANWVNTSFILTFAIGTAVYGKLSDVYGVKKLLLIGLLLYGTGSIVGVVFHVYYPGVFAARFIQGAGISAVPALIMIIVARCIEPNQQGRAFGLIGSMVAFGEAIGPVIGGMITNYLHWSYLFILPILTLLTLPFFIQTLPGESMREGKTDVLGAILLSLGILTFTLFTTMFQWSFLAISILLFIGFTWRIRRAEQPFIEPSLFSRKTFIVGVLTGSILLGTAAGYVAMVPYMMKDVYQMPTSLIGAGILFPGTVSVILFGYLGGICVDRRGNLFTMAIGIGMITVSFLSVALVADRTPWLITCAMILTFGGLALVKTVISTSVAGSLHSEESGSGMGLLNFACFLAEGMGVAIVGGLLTKPWLAVSFLPTVTDAAAFLYSNMMLLFITAIIIGSIVYFSVYGRLPSASEQPSTSE
ncbi:MFS transporter [Paenibacillus sp. GCM10027629]|uniref:MFS transporter n=1 Tax=Paenibacillus sp. GCM10027629 TaxID=3273414 RepID=UPI003632D8A4